MKTHSAFPLPPCSPVQGLLEFDHLISSFVPHAAPEPGSSPRALPSSELPSPWKAQGPPLHPLLSGSLPSGIASSVQSKAEPSGHSLASLQSRYLTSLTLFRRPRESRKEVGNWQVCAYFFWLGISRGFLEVRLIMPIHISTNNPPEAVMERGRHRSDACSPVNTVSFFVLYTWFCRWRAEPPRRALMEQEVKQPGQRVTRMDLLTPASSAALTTLKKLDADCALGSHKCQGPLG